MPVNKRCALSSNCISVLSEFRNQVLQFPHYYEIITSPSLSPELHGEKSGKFKYG